MALMMVGMIGGAFGLGIFFASGGSVAVLAVLVAFALAVLVVYLLFYGAIQFYGHAIVIEGHRAIDGLKRSVAVVRSNLRSVAGYYALILLGGGLVGGGYGLFVNRLLPPPEPGEPAPLPDVETALIAVLLTATLLTISSTVYFVYSVVFYREVALSSAVTQSTSSQ